MDELIKHFGSQKELAKALGVKHGHIYWWIKNGIPVKRVLQIEKMFPDGRFNRRILLPEIFND